MKKNFIKKLAFVMASALVVSGAAPAAQADAALKDVKLNKESKTLYLNADNEIGNKFDFNYKKLGKKADYKVKWSVEDDSIVDLAKGGVVTAKKVGTTTVYCKITRKSTGKSVTLDATVTVKANAKTVEINNAPESGKILVGETYDFNRTMKDANGKKATDKTAWEIVGDNTAAATVDKNGKVTATKAGEFTLKVSTYQSKATKDQPTATDEVTVKVVTDTVDAKQTTLTKFDLSFLSDVSKTVTKDNLEVYRVVGTTEVKEVVKAITFNTDGTVATVELFNTMADGVKYIVKVNDMTTREYTATVGDVASVEFVTDKAVYQVPTDVKVKLLNTQGVDITSPTLLARVDLSLVDTTVTNAYLDTTNKQITIFNEGDKVAVKATFHTYNFDKVTGDEALVTTVGTITGVNASSVDITSEVEYDITTGTTNWSSVNHKMGAEDAGYKLNVRFKMTDGSYEVATAGAGYTFQSADENYLLVDPSTGELYPVKPGTVQVLVKKADKVLTAVSVEIVAKRTLTTFSLKNATATVSNSANIGDNSTVTIGYSAKDNLGADVKGASYVVTPLGTAPANIINGLTLDATNVAAGTYLYKVTATVGDVSKSQIFTLVVQAPTVQTQASYYKLELNKNVMDLAIDTDNAEDTKNVTFKLVGYASNGVAMEVASGSNFTYEIKKNTTLAKDANGVELKGQFLSTAQDAFGNITIDTVAVGSDNIYDKMETGSYTITASKDGKVVNQANFTITNNQKSVVTVSQKAIKSAATGADLQAAILAKSDVTAFIDEAFVITLNGNTITSTDTVKVTSGFYELSGTVLNNSIYVKSVKYAETINGSVIEHVINIGKTVTVNQK